MKHRITLLLCALAAAAPAPAMADTPDRLIALWRGEHTHAECISGTYGTVIGGVGYAEGRFGTAFSFDGSSWIDIPESVTPAVDIAEGQSFSYGAWVMRTSDSGSTMHVFGKRAGCGGGQAFYQLPLHNFPVDGMMYSDFPLNQWTFYMVTEEYMGEGNYHFRLYLNGVLHLGDATRPYAPQNDGPFCIGRSGGCSTFTGRVDEMMLFGRALTDEEVLGLYETQVCEGDVDGSGTADVEDLLFVLAEWGSLGCGGADLDGDGVVAVGDILLLLAAWGPCE